MSKSKATKKVTKKSQGDAIFAQELANRVKGTFDSNKAFRAQVLQRMEAEIGVSRASAATMFNQAKIATEAADTTVVLGRDPKAVKPKAKRKAKAVKVVTAEIEPDTQKANA